MEVAEKEVSMTPDWASSTNWLVADGSLEGAITLMTSSSTTEDADLIPVAVMLEKPMGSSPCEVTISFREKHEIHSIYVRSTARIYEIYYSSDKQISSNEYLCTVRCGAAAPEDENAVLPRSDSNNTMEDGWVEIKAPESLLQERKILSLSNLSGENISPISQIHYEATAEISDSSPYMSITLRFLSLQNKTSVRIEEIYIFADLIEDIDPDPPVCNVATGSLLSMLVPGILHLSGSGSLQFNKVFPDATTSSKFSSFSDKATDVSFPDMSEISEVAASSMMGSSEVGLDKHHISKLKTDDNIGAHGCVENALDEPIVNHTQTKIAELERGLDQSQNAKSNEISDPYVHLEKVLDDLVSRVGRIENFCLSFQESILKPLTGIDLRLQRMEEKLDAFSHAAPRSSETDPSSRTSYHSEHNSYLENEGCISLSAVTELSSHEKATAIDELTVSLPEALKSTGLVVKAPEFPDDDDDCDDDDESTSNHNFVSLTPNEYLKNDTPLSIDSALASALAAFVTSTTDRSYEHNPYPMDVPNEKQLGDNYFGDSAYGAAVSIVEWVLEDRDCDVPHEAQGKISWSDKSCCDLHDPDDTLKKVDTFHITEAKMQRDCLCDECFLPGDDSSAEIHTHETKGLIIRQPEFPYGDDFPNCNIISDSRVSDYADPHSHDFPNSESTSPLALFLSSGRTSSSKSSLNSHDDCILEPSFDDVFSRSKLHPECSELSVMDSFTGAIPVTGQHSESSETLDVISWMNSYYNLKQVSVIPCQDDMTSNIKFNADETLKSWLPLEVLLGKKLDDKVHNSEDLISNLEFHVNGNFTSGFPPEILDEKICDQIESSNYANDTGIDQQLIPLKAQALIQRSEIVDNTLLDLTCNVDQYEISGIMKGGTPISPECFSSGQPFSSLI